MSSPSMSATRLQQRHRSHADHADPILNVCIGPSGNSRPDNLGRRCKHPVVWNIIGVGKFCHGCYEAFFAANWRDISLDEIERLSDDERQFFRGNEGGR